MDRRETERLLEVIRQARAAGEPAALATIVRVTGSAYRREGTRMFVRQNGTYVCSLSGGCLEPAVAETAARVIASGEPVVVSYDLADDSIWGLGLGCSGAVDVLIERLEDDVVMRAWFTILERSEPAVLVTPLSGISGRMVVSGAGLVPVACPMPSSNSRRSSVPVTGCVRRTRIWSRVVSPTPSFSSKSRCRRPTS